MRPTRPGDLVVVLLGATLLAWLLARGFYGLLPPVPLLAGASLLVLAGVEVGLARVLRGRISRREGARALDPIMAARSVALAKASSLAGVVVAGAWAGLGVHLLAERSRLTAAVADTPGTVVGLVSALALVAAGLVLERSCRTPDGPGRR